MHEKSVGNVREPQERLLILARNRLLTEIGARHHKNIQSAIEKQSMQRGIGQHDAKPLIARRYGWCKGHTLPLFQEHNGRLGRAQGGKLTLTHLAATLHQLQITHHDGKRFGFTSLSLPQASNRRLISSVHSKMKAPDPFQRNNQPLFEQRHSGSDSVTRQQRT